MQYLRRFDCTAFVHTPKQLRSKWDSISVKMVMVGYDGYCSNYRLFNPQSQKITISRDVTFKEDLIKHDLNSEDKYISFEWLDILKNNDTEEPQFNNSTIQQSTRGL